MAIIIPNVDKADNCFDCVCCYDNYMCSVLQRAFWGDDTREGFDPATDCLEDCPIQQADINEGE